MEILKQAKLLGAATNPMRDAMLRIIGERLEKEKAELEKQKELAQHKPKPWNPTLPPGLPPATPNWCENFSRLGGDMKASPLPTRQLKRHTARLMARLMASAAKVKARKLKGETEGRRRAREELGNVS